MFIHLLFGVLIGVSQGAPRQPPATVLLIPLEAENDQATNDYKRVFPLTSPDAGVLFDIDADGVLEQIAWTQPNSPVAFLVIDKNENGRIDSGAEMIGSHVIEGARSAVKALADLRIAMDPGVALSGAVRHRDPLYSKLLLWRDTNHNGVSEPDELWPANELVTKVGLGYSGFDRYDDHGNFFRFQGWIELRTAPGPNEPDGPLDHLSRTRRIYEVALRWR